MQINVTQNHIDDGDIGGCTSCPIALAILEVLHENYGVCVDNTEIIIFERESKIKVQEFRTPKNVQAFVTNFDDENLVTLFTFNLNLNTEVLKYVD
jgi:hypothetical protein